MAPSRTPCNSAVTLTAMPKRPAADPPAESSGGATSRSPFLDVDALSQAIKDRRANAGASIRQAAADAGISFMTFARVEAGSQPDLSTFLALCGWLRVEPQQFLIATPARETSTLEAVTRHLVADPALDRDAAERIAAVVRDMYEVLARSVGAKPAVACHLRAATVLRPGVPDRLGRLLEDMRDELDAKVSEGAL
jgi:transcriptional regulator with XRE-family HTH domain